jgi:hypothetical protein
MYGNGGGRLARPPAPPVRSPGRFDEAVLAVVAVVDREAGILLTMIDGPTGHRAARIAL